MLWSGAITKLSDVLEKIEKTLNNTHTALAAGWEKEGELATSSLEFEFRLEFPCGSSSTVSFPPIIGSRNKCECKQTSKSTCQG